MGCLCQPSRDDERNNPPSPPTSPFHDALLLPSSSKDHLAPSTSEGQQATGSQSAQRHPAILSPLSRLDIPAGRRIRSPGGSWGPFPAALSASPSHLLPIFFLQVPAALDRVCLLASAYRRVPPPPPQQASPLSSTTGDPVLYVYAVTRSAGLFRSLDGGSGWALGTAKSTDDRPHKKSYPRHSPRPLSSVQKRPSSRRGQLDVVVVIL